MRLLRIAVAVASALSAQTYQVSNLSNQDLDELELFEQRDTVLKRSEIFTKPEARAHICSPWLRRFVLSFRPNSKPITRLVLG